MTHLRLCYPLSTWNLLLAAVFIPCSLAIQLCGGSDGTQYSGSYTDGSGTYITSNDYTKEDLIYKCWYEYYLLNSTLYNASWRKSSGNIECAGTSTCSVSQLNGTEFCQTRTTTISADVSISIDFFQASFGYSVALSTEGCYTATNTDACEWTDGGCHSVWTQQQLVKQVGYKRQICNDGDKLDDKKKVTKCMADFETDTPTTLTNYGCAAKCDGEFNGTAETSTGLVIATTIGGTGVSSSTGLLVQVTADPTQTLSQSAVVSGKATSTPTHTTSKNSGSSLSVPSFVPKFRVVLSVMVGLAIPHVFVR